MKQQIRIGVFETNSSSTHALSVVEQEDYEQWKNGKLVARVVSRKESPDPAGNFWSYIYDVEFAPIGKRDVLNRQYLKDNYTNFSDPSNGWKPFTSPDKLLEYYNRGEFKGDMMLYVTYEEFMEFGFSNSGCYIEHFSHDTANGLKVFGTYYHS